MQKHRKSILALVTMATLATGSIDTSNVQTTPKAPPTPQETRQSQIDGQFSPWNGSHINLTKAIKASMNNPDSFDHVETTYREIGDELIVTERFRGTNAFGGIVTQSVTARVDLSGNIIETISTE